jgi:hypothetical protein
MTWLPSVLRCRFTETKPGWVAMKRARSIIRFKTSSCLPGGSLTVVIWVQMPSLLLISDMTASFLPGLHVNAWPGSGFRAAEQARLR